jgi:hypothetical protein
MPRGELVRGKPHEGAAVDRAEDPLDHVAQRRRFHQMANHPRIARYVHPCHAIRSGNPSGQRSQPDLETRALGGMGA